MTYPGAESRRKNKALSAGWSEPTIAHRPTNVVQEEQGHFRRRRLQTTGTWRLQDSLTRERERGPGQAEAG
jgi:hypothetical protein